MCCRCAKSAGLYRQQYCLLRTCKMSQMAFMQLALIAYPGFECPAPEVHAERGIDSILWRPAAHMQPHLHH